MTTQKSELTTSPFASELFCALWLGTVLANVATWMQNVGAGWVMLSLTPSPFMVALVQTATLLPAFILGLPAGVMADMLDRRQMLLWTHVLMLIASAALAVVSLLGLLAPWSLLLLTFSIGCCSALVITARQVSISDTVPRSALLHALALNGIAYNGARAVGPAMAGLLLAWLGPSAVFLATTVLFASVVVIQSRFYKPPRRAAIANEGVLDSMLAGIRYVRHAPILHAYLLRNILFVSFASSLWALLPLLAQQRMGFGAGGYGLLLGCLGVGAVLFGSLLQRLRQRFSLDALATASGGAFAVAILFAALSSNQMIVCFALFAGGAAWVVINAITMAAVQTVVPAWVRARAVSIYLLVFQGAMALGGAAWGAVASHLSLSLTLTSAAILTLLGVCFARRYPMRLGQEADVTPSTHWIETAVWNEPDPDDGPVAIQHEYRIKQEEKREFIRAVHALGVTRKRDGASHWQLYSDLSDPELYVERFIIHSWADHQRQLKRATETDRINEELVRQMHGSDQPIRTSHFIAQAVERGKI